MMTKTERYAAEPVWAVVGASDDPNKFGNKILRTLRNAGYTAYAVNNRHDTVLGRPAFARVTDLPETPTVVNMVIPPEHADAVVRDAIEAGAEAIWFQPGAESESAAKIAREAGLDVIHDCILVQHRRSGPVPQMS